MQIFVKQNKARYSNGEAVGGKHSKNRLLKLLDAVCTELSLGPNLRERSVIIYLDLLDGDQFELRRV